MQIFFKHLQIQDLIAYLYNSYIFTIYMNFKLCVTLCYVLFYIDNIILVYISPIKMRAITRSLCLLHPAHCQESCVEHRGTHNII